MAKRVVVFGSCNLDLFFDLPDMAFFTRSGVGAEDALHFAIHKQAPGGKGANQAVAAAMAGAKVHFFGAIGRGAYGQMLLENFKKLKINISGLAELNVPTGLAVIFKNPDGRHKIIVSHSANHMAKASQVPDSILNKNSIVVFQAETDPKQNALLMRRAKNRGATVVFNVAPASRIPAKVLACVDYLILNRPEAEVVAENLGMSTSNLRSFARAMGKKFKMTCIVTLGEEGAIASVGGAEAVSVPSLKINAIDTVGAGDAFVGAFVAALAKGIEVEDALRHGAVAGSLACTRVGAQTALPSQKEIAKNLPKLGKGIGNRRRNRTFSLNRLRTRSLSV